MGRAAASPRKSTLGARGSSSVEKLGSRRRMLPPRPFTGSIASHAPLSARERAWPEVNPARSGSRVIAPNVRRIIGAATRRDAPPRAGGAGGTSPAGRRPGACQAMTAAPAAAVFCFATKRRSGQSGAYRPFHKPGAGCTACPRCSRSRRTAISSSCPIEHTTDAHAIPAALPSPARARLCSPARTPRCRSSSQASARVNRVPASTRQVVLLLRREGGRLVKSLDVADEDRPLRERGARASGCSHPKGLRKC
jgi:hypothetical protein